MAGIVCPYNAPTDIYEWGTTYREQFAPGSFARAIAAPERVKFLEQHDRQALPLGRATLFREDAKGLYGEFHISKTQRGDEALELMRDMAFDGFSVGFRSIMPAHDEPIRSGSLVTRKDVDLAEVSAVTFPAYDGARISEIRSATAVAAEIGMLIERVGKTHSAATTAQLKKVLDLIARADDNVDEALVQLSDLMGVPNPDDEADEPSDSDDKTSGPAPDERGRALYQIALRRARLSGLLSGHEIERHLS